MNVPEGIIKLMIRLYPQTRIVFDSFGLNPLWMQIVNDHEVKCVRLTRTDDSSPGITHFGGSVRLKCAMPTKENNIGNVSSIFWELIPIKLRYWRNYINSFGVVSNRTKEFKNAYNGLKDAYGVGLYPGNVFKGKTKSVVDISATELFKEGVFKKGNKMGIEYIVNESKLRFYGDDAAEPQYTMDLPTNISGITHWYPYVSLRDKDDVCKIGRTIIKYNN